ncbi:lipoprotein [Streptomyces thermocarboxydovorans]|uniref:Lipoprotein n=1 Tax=Streptomyces thermocarboxydovorans TaxID=59298 RepID=A0ABN1HIN9_9ACTN
MIRPSRTVRVLAAVVASGALLTTAACSGDGGDGETRSAEVAASPKESRAAAPAARQTTTPAGDLTEEGARAALITEADIEDDWTQVDDAEKWRDSLLIGDVDVDDFITAEADAADCQRLLDGLYSEELLGKPSGASALTGFTQGDSRLLYQVAAYDRAELDDSMNWLESLPEKCDQFTATASGGEERTVQVVEYQLPDEGDERQGLEVTVQGTVDGSPATLTLDIGVVRVGSDALTVTAGGLNGGEKDSVEAALQQGTERLKDVLAGRTPPASPTS